MSSTSLQARARAVAREGERPASMMAAEVASLPILGLPVLDLSWSEGLDFLDMRLSEAGSFGHIAFLNANNANIMVRDSAYRDVLERSIVLADGIGVDIAARLLHGARFSANLNGTDLVPALLTYIETPLRVGLIGATSSVLEDAARNFRRHAPWHSFVEISDGYFDRAEPGVIVERISAAKLDLLLVAMGTPLQEKWVDRHLGPSHARVVMSVGALLDFVSGHVPRAPNRFRRLRLEWLYRLWLEPSRLWRRYVVGIPVFLFHIWRHRAKGRAQATSR
ncbi:WecB/TagA/CpsF family glycosyltransferase [Rhizobium sp. AAP43]|uniref:WecB/TagA/CpsF family glycosyltransferase n=1 Tax=Rhizobium sp. AAP43 TaxID=1523420 RepID=UPI000A5CDC2D|nr:WecB/TagA/CpsF family glycosyltransferase [Rhizobium sp. AAP43]